MSVKLLSESMGSTMTDDDQARIEQILSFWFKEQELSAPQIDRRMDIWFGEDPVFDHEIEKEFADDIEKASEGKLNHWADEPHGRLALIILIDQFRRNIYRGTLKAFSHDKVALKLCVEGAMEKKDKGLTPIQRVFFYMPLQHAESAQSPGEVGRTLRAARGVRFPNAAGDVPDRCAVRRIAQGHHRSIRTFPPPQRIAGSRKHA